MKKILLLAFIIVLCIFNLNAEEIFESDEFKFKMEIPEGFEYKTYKDGEWGILEGYEATSKTYVYAYGYIGEVEKQEIYDFGVKQSGVKEKYWEKVDEGGGNSGFEWWEKFKAEGKKYSLYAILGKNANDDIYYLFFVLAPKKSFKKYEKDYIKWLKSCEGLE